MVLPTPLTYSGRLDSNKGTSRLQIPGPELRPRPYPHYEPNTDGVTIPV